MNTIQDPPSVIDIKLGDALVEIKSRRDYRHPSGWSVIAFTPDCSLRSVRCHDATSLNHFARAIAASVGAVPSPEELASIEANILKTTDL